jgi:hypothetical protein
MEEQNVSILNKIPVLNMIYPKPITNRTILVGQDNKIIHLAFENKMVPPNEAPEIEYYATGNFDSCSETLTVDTPTAFQGK